MLRMLSAMKGFVIPVIVVVASAHTALSVAQYHRIQRLNNEVIDLIVQVEMLTRSYDLCTTQSEAKDNEISALKGMVDMLVEKESSIRDEYQTLSDRWDKLKRGKGGCGSEENIPENINDSSVVPFLVDEYVLLEQAYCYAGGGDCIPSRSSSEAPTAR